jgi:hypothetical protein
MTLRAVAAVPRTNEPEADSKAGVGGDEADASGRASTTFVSVEPRPCP